MCREFQTCKTLVAVVLLLHHVRLEQLITALQNDNAVLAAVGEQCTPHEKTAAVLTLFEGNCISAALESANICYGVSRTN